MKTRIRKGMALLMTLLMLFIQMASPAGHDHAHAEEAPAAPEVIRGQFRYAGAYGSRDAQAEYAYSDAYFSGDARVYDPSLATMSLCLEIASWPSLEEANWSDKTVNARQLLEAIGFTGFAQNEFWNDAPTVDSIGVVAAHKAIGDATVIALAVRGGGYYSEWGGNLLLGGEGSHAGFAAARDHVLAFAHEYVENHGVTGRVKLWIVGFSRGGAVANLAAGALLADGLPGGVTLDPADLYCYTFEAPQGAVDTGADADYASIHNIVNANDIVPLMAPGQWGFGRYNATSHLLPTITTTHYAQALAQMQQHYADILAGAPVEDPARAAYGVAEYARTLEVNVNWLRFMPGSGPFVEVELVEDTHLPTALMLVESVDALARAAGGREGYTGVEAELSRMLGEMLSAGSGSSMGGYVQQLGAVFTADNYANALYVLEPMLQLNLTSLDKRMEQVAARLRDVLMRFGADETAAQAIDALSGLMAKMITEDPRQLLDLVMSLAGTNLMQAHYAEVTLAWLRTEDPNFTDTPFAYAVPEQMRALRVNCPVDLYVYNSRQELVASMTGSQCRVLVEGVGCAIDENGEKIIWLPADEEFSVSILATGEGDVYCSVNEFNIVRGKYTRIVSFPAMAVVDGDGLTALLPAIPPEEYTDEPETGSTVKYTLFRNGAPAGQGDDLRGGEVSWHFVIAERNNESGQVRGGGAYLRESFAQVEAYPVSGGAFEGWYVGSECVSTEATYRFPVRGDVTVVAHFTPAPTGSVTFVASEGGKVDNVDATYPVGSYVLLSAAADEGFLFGGWSATAGEIVRMEDGTVYLVVAEGDATVTAAFARAGITCPGCKQVLPEGTHHLALCGRYGHYTCLRNFDPREHVRCPICRTGHLCEGGHGEGLCGAHTCEACGVEIPADETHASPCGTEGHWTCADDYVASEHETCPYCSELLCNGADHGECTICGEGHVCEGGHGTGSGECGVYTCENCGVEILTTETHASPCGTEGHWTCADDYVASEHETCAYCSELLCNGADHGECTICGEGHICEGGHGTGSGECGVYACENCGVEIPIDETHASPCGIAGHWTCADDYVASEHETCAYCSELLCNGADHGECTICGEGHVCEGGHGTGSGECGVYACENCGVEILTTETHASPCGTEGHWTCADDYVASEHETCSYCSELLCNGADHGECTICGEGHVCEGGHGTGSGECGVYACENCGVEIPIDESHASPCGTEGHWTCADDYVASEHEICPYCSELLCNGADHGECTICGEGHVCEGGHGTGSGECGMYACENCGVEIPIDETHASPCGTEGHWTCADDYVASEHEICPYCSELLCNGADHGECTICGEGHVCEGGHGTGSGECGVYACENCGVEIPIDESHASPCGTEGHWTCADDYVAAEHETCPYCSELLCNGADHGECTICGEGHVCEGGHGTGSGECGVYACENCGVEIPIDETHASPCGIAGHWTCADDYVASEHEICPYCSDLLCNGADHGECTICGEGHVCEGGHGTGSGECGVYACENCGVEIPIDETHASPCGTEGHWTCADDYVASEHEICPYCSDLLCNGADHGECTICGEGHVCEGGHGTGSGECGMYACENCGVEIPIDETHASPCGIAGHWTCADDYVASEHEICPYCSELLCNGADHGECTICGEGHLCEGGHGTGSGECGVYVCENCDVEIPIDESHASPCGIAGHWTCEADYVASEHAVCEQCSDPLCDGKNHNLCPLCEDGYVCQGGHGYGEGQCSGPGPSIAWEYCGNCENWLADETHLAPCGVHFTCESGYNASEHTTLCSLCGGHACDGRHGTGAGECCDPALVTGTCEWCGNAIYHDRNHHADCWAHHTCDAGFVAEEHALCTLCYSGYLCEGVHGTGLGQCSYVDPADLVTCAMCGVTVNINWDSPHLGPCGRHHTCQTLDYYFDHDECHHCGRYLCDGSCHDYCYDCGYAVCHPEQKHTVCSVCGEYVCSANEDNHGDGVCGTALTAGVRTLGWEILPIPGVAVAGCVALIPLQRRKKEE